MREPCPSHACPACGDRLIHQMNRGPKESSSVFGQWVYDHVPHEFDFVDIDGLVYRRSTGVLYVIEEKHGSRMSEAQRHILPLLDRAVELLIADGSIDPRSKVLELHGRYDPDRLLTEATVWPPERIGWNGAVPKLTAQDLALVLRGRKFLEDW